MVLYARGPEPIALRRTPIAVELSGTDGRAKRYSVIPVKSGSRIRWLDALVSGSRFHLFPRIFRAPTGSHTITTLSFVKAKPLW